MLAMKKNGETLTDAEEVKVTGLSDEDNEKADRRKIHAADKKLLSE